MTAEQFEALKAWVRAEALNAISDYDFERDVITNSWGDLAHAEQAARKALVEDGDGRQD